jgi:hypothetical protein
VQKRPEERGKQRQRRAVGAFNELTRTNSVGRRQRASRLRGHVDRIQNVGQRTDDPIDGPRPLGDTGPPQPVVDEFIEVVDGRVESDQRSVVREFGLVRSQHLGGPRPEVVAVGEDRDPQARRIDGAGGQLEFVKPDQRGELAEIRQRTERFQRAGTDLRRESERDDRDRCTVAKVRVDRALVRAPRKVFLRTFPEAFAGHHLEQLSRQGRGTFANVGRDPRRGGFGGAYEVGDYPRGRRHVESDAVVGPWRTPPHVRERQGRDRPGRPQLTGYDLRNQITLWSLGRRHTFERDTAC